MAHLLGISYAPPDVAASPVEEPAAPVVAEPQAKQLKPARTAKPRSMSKGRAGAVLPPALKARGKRAKGDGAPSGTRP